MIGTCLLAASAIPAGWNGLSAVTLPELRPFALGASIADVIVAGAYTSQSSAPVSTQLQLLVNGEVSLAAPQTGDVLVLREIVTDTEGAVAVFYSNSVVVSPSIDTRLWDFEVIDDTLRIDAFPDIPLLPAWSVDQPSASIDIAAYPGMNA